MDRDLLLSICPALRTALNRSRYDLDAVRELLGPEAHAAYGRGEPVPARRAARLDAAYTAWDEATTVIDQARNKQMAAPGLQEEGPLPRLTDGAGQCREDRRRCAVGADRRLLGQTGVRPP